MGNSADGSSNLARLAKKKKRKKENSLRSESDFSEKDNPNQKTDKKQRARGFPGGPVIKNLSSNVRDASLIAGGGTKFPHVSWQKKKKKSISFASNELSLTV